MARSKLNSLWVERPEAAAGVGLIGLPARAPLRPHRKVTQLVTFTPGTSFGYLQAGPDKKEKKRVTDAIWAKYP